MIIIFKKIKPNADDLSNFAISTTKSVENRIAMEVPSPVFASIVLYVVRDGHISQMVAEVTLAPYLEVVYQHMMHSGEDKIFNFTLLPDRSEMITKEKSGSNWLDSVEHMLVKNPNGSPKDGCSGPIIHYWFSQEKA